ncbi:MAG TPA: NrsF family protein [Bryobacteraceae bacterium]|jgi:hypothetical protein
MINHSPKPPEALLRAIAEDLKPVKPSPRPLRRALQMAPVALLVSSLILLAVGIRSDFRMLGPLLTWGASAAQFMLAMMLVWIAAHESTPAGRLPKGAVYSATAAAFLVVVAITLSTFSVSPVGGTLRVAGGASKAPLWIVDLICGVGSTVAGGILVWVFTRMFRNSLATRPTVAGALYGAGAGLAINAGWRIACPFSTPEHSLGAHGAAIVATAILGALIGRSVGRRRLLHITRP